MKARRRKSVRSIHFKFKFRPDERRVDIGQKDRELFTNKKATSVRRGKKTDDRDLSNIVDIDRSDYNEGNKFGSARDNRKRRSFSRYKFQIHSSGKICEKVYQTLVRAFILSRRGG